jgi:dihydrofolate synthase/folylpolyglutamate synthase
LAGQPPTILDAAHNPDAARALAEAIEKIAAGRPVIACLATLADKDAAGIVNTLEPRLAGLVATEIPAELLARVARPGARASAAAELAAGAVEAGVGWVREEPDPVAAIALARARAEELGGVALVTGSHYLLRYATG